MGYDDNDDDIDRCEHDRRWSECRSCTENAKGCGCCGQSTGGAEWCRDCSRHVAATGAPWDRTFFGQYGVDCPFQVE